MTNRILTTILFLNASVLVYAQGWESTVQTTGQTAVVIDNTIVQPLPCGSTPPNLPTNSTQQRSHTPYPTELVKLANQLNNDASRIFEYVRSRITPEYYYGVRKGPVQTLYDGTANDYDKVNLYIELCKAAGLDTSSLYFVRCIDKIPIKSNENTYSLESMFGQALNTETEIQKACASLPHVTRLTNSTGSSTLAILFPRILLGVVSNNGLITYDLTLNECIFTPAQPLPLLQKNALYAAGAGTITNNKISNINTNGLFAYLSSQSATLAQSESATVDESEFLGKIEYTGNTLPSAEIITFNSYPNIYSLDNIQSNDAYTPSFYYIDSNGQKSLSTQYDTTNNVLHAIVYKNIPDGDCCKLTIKVLDLNSVTLRNWEILTKDLNSQNLWMYFADSKGYLCFDDNSPHLEFPAANNSQINIFAKFSHPVDILKSGSQRVSEYSSQNSYNVNDNYVYSLVYAFTASDKLLNFRRSQYQKNFAGYSISNNSALNYTDKRFIAETLYIMGLDWMYQSQCLSSLIYKVYGKHTHYSHRFGRVAQEAGYYIDIPLQLTNYMSKDDETSNPFRIASFFNSALEHAIIQQTQGDVDAVSTINIFHYANAMESPIPLVLLENSAFDASQLNGYSTSEITKFRELLSGATSTDYRCVLLPENRNATPTNSNWDWSGYGYVSLSNLSIGMIIAGNLNGGYAVQAGICDSDILSECIAMLNIENGSVSEFDPLNADYSSMMLLSGVSKDPVDMRSGAYLLEAKDISSGSLQFVRFYNSNKSDVKSDLGYGWSHNFDISLAVKSSPTVSIEKGSVSQMARTIVGLHALKTIFSEDITTDSTVSNRVRALSFGCFLSKWVVDSIWNNTVVFKHGKNYFSFTKKDELITENGETINVEGYSAPIATNLELKIEDGLFKITQPYKDTIYFNNALKPIQIVDIFGKTISFQYNTNGTLHAIYDKYQKGLLIEYNEDGLISKVLDADDNSRYSAFTYADTLLTNATLSGLSCGSYEYNSNKLTTYKNGGGDIVVQNIYNSEGQVSTQKAYGLDTHIWNLSYAPDKSVESGPCNITRSFWYNKDGLLSSKIDELGNETLYNYDDKTRIVSSQNPNGDIVRFTYDRFNNILTEDTYALRTSTDASGTSTSTLEWQSGIVNEYDDSDIPRLSTSIRKCNETNLDNGRSTQIVDYLTLNNYKTKLPLSIVDETGIITTYTYDDLGRVLTKNVAGEITNYAYANSQFYDKPTTITHSSGVVEQISYNTQGDIATISKNSLTTEFSYNVRRQVTTTKTKIDNAVYSEEFKEYNNDGRLVKEINPLGITTEYQWSSQGKLTKLTKTSGATSLSTEYSYDAADRLISTKYPDGKIITYLPNAKGDPIQQTLASRTTAMEYDSLGRQTKITSPLGNSNRTLYDTNNNIIKAIDANNASIEYTYNTFGDLTSVKNRKGDVYYYTKNVPQHTETHTTPEGKTYTSTFSSQTGKLSSFQTPSGAVTSYTYGANGLISSFVDDLGSCNYTYDNLGRIVAITENGNSISFTYDALGRITSSSDLYGVVYYEYSKTHKLTKITYPAINGFATRSVTYQYDAFDRLQTVTDWAGRQFIYAYNAAGQLDRVIRPNNTYQQYVYDSNTGELVQIAERKQNNDLIHITALTNDSDGRIIRKISVPNMVIPKRLPFTATYDKDNKLTSYNELSIYYNQDGCMLNVPHKQSQLLCDYDTRNRLISVNDMEHVYDSSNFRITTFKQSTNLQNIWDDNRMFSQGTYVNAPNKNTTPIEVPITSATLNMSRGCLIIVTSMEMPNSEIIGNNMVDPTPYTLTGVEGQIVKNIEITTTTTDETTGEPITTTSTEQRATSISDLTWYIHNSNHATKTYTLRLTQSPKNVIGDSFLEGSTVSSVSNTAKCNYNRVTYQPKYYKALVDVAVGTPVTDATAWEFIGEKLLDKTVYINSRNSAIPQTLIRAQYDYKNNVKYTTYYVYGIGIEAEISISVDENGNEVETPKFYHYDQIGSTVALTDISANITDRFAYEPWGTSYHTLGNTNTPFKYAGRFGVQTDDSGLLYMRARYYSPTVMRFINSDPTGFHGGTNWYLYANGNPFSNVDITGNVAETAWDVVSLTMGLASFSSNIASGEYGWAIVDAVGIAYDAVATATPFLPAGLSAAKVAFTHTKSATTAFNVAKDYNTVAKTTDNVIKSGVLADKLSPTQYGTKLHGEVSESLKGIKTFNYKSLANTSRGGPDFQTKNYEKYWMDITTPGSWKRHVRQYTNQYGEGLHILYNAYDSVDELRLYSGAGATLGVLEIFSELFSK